MSQKSNSVGRPPLPENEKASSQMQFRVSQKRKAAYVKAASKKQQTLVAWSFEKLDAASGYTGD
jgi:predicted HicB family RNase H-like nuclease